jgi:hypothetical protein
MKLFMRAINSCTFLISTSILLGKKEMIVIRKKVKIIKLIELIVFGSILRHIRKLHV